MTTTYRAIGGRPAEVVRSPADLLRRRAVAVAAPPVTPPDDVDVEVPAYAALSDPDGPLAAYSTPGTRVRVTGGPDAGTFVLTDSERPSDGGLTAVAAANCSALQTAPMQDGTVDLQALSGHAHLELRSVVCDLGAHDVYGPESVDWTAFHNHGTNGDHGNGALIDAAAGTVRFPQPVASRARQNNGGAEGTFSYRYATGPLRWEREVPPRRVAWSETYTGVQMVDVPGGQTPVLVEYEGEHVREADTRYVQCRWFGATPMPSGYVRVPGAPDTPDAGYAPAGGDPEHMGAIWAHHPVYDVSGRISWALRAAQARWRADGGVEGATRAAPYNVEPWVVLTEAGDVYGHHHSPECPYGVVEAASNRPNWFLGNADGSGPTDVTDPAVYDHVADEADLRDAPWRAGRMILKGSYHLVMRRRGGFRDPAYGGRDPFPVELFYNNREVWPNGAVRGYDAALSQWHGLALDGGLTENEYVLTDPAYAAGYQEPEGGTDDGDNYATGVFRNTPRGCGFVTGVSSQVGDVPARTVLRDCWLYDWPNCPYLGNTWMSMETSARLRMTNMPCNHWYGGTTMPGGAVADVVLEGDCLEQPLVTYSLTVARLLVRPTRRNRTGYASRGSDGYAAAFKKRHQSSTWQEVLDNGGPGVDFGQNNRHTAGDSLVVLGVVMDFRAGYRSARVLDQEGGTNRVRGLRVLGWDPAWGSMGVTGGGGWDGSPAHDHRFVLEDFRMPTSKNLNDDDVGVSVLRDGVFETTGDTSGSGTVATVRGGRRRDGAGDPLPSLLVLDNVVMEDLQAGNELVASSYYDGSNPHPTAGVEVHVRDSTVGTVGEQMRRSERGPTGAFVQSSTLAKAWEATSYGAGVVTTGGAPLTDPALPVDYVFPEIP